MRRSNTTWMEKVSDEQYSHGPAATQEPLKTQEANNMNKEPSAIKKTYGDFAPKLVQITDDALFGDIWSVQNSLSVTAVLSPSPRLSPVGTPSNCPST